MALNDSGPLPLVIGVTGHRDLRAQDYSALEQEVRRTLQDFKNTWPSTRMVMLSALAEGADRLVARAALELGFRLIVPLPMPRDEYVKDFVTAQSRAEFDGLLKQADKSFEVSLVQEVGEGEILDEKSRQERGYALVGAYIARHSQILLALWDGQELKKTGGTSQVVKFKLQGVSAPFAPLRSPLDPLEGGPVYHLVTPRASNSRPEPGRLAFRVRKLFPQGYESAAEAERAYDRIFRRMERFNGDACRLRAALASQRHKSKQDVVPENEAATLSAGVRTCLEWFAVADSLALHYQRLTLWTLRGLLLLVFVAAVCFQAYSVVEPKPWVLAVVYLAALGGAYAWYLWARWGGDYHTKHLDYRALAEGLRVLLFWRLAGLRQPVADHYLRKQRSDMDWIRDAIRVWTIPAKIESGSPPASAADAKGLPLVLTRWVENQRDFFTRASRRDKVKSQIIGLLGYGFFLAGLGLAVIRVFLDPEDPLILAMSLTLVVSALLAAYARVLGLSEHANQYDRMRQFFGMGAKHLKTLLQEGRHDQAREIIKELGQEALIENGDWLLFHRGQPVKVPDAKEG